MCQVRLDRSNWQAYGSTERSNLEPTEQSGKNCTALRMLGRTRSLNWSTSEAWSNCREVLVCFYMINFLVWKAMITMTRETSPSSIWQRRNLKTQFYWSLRLGLPFTRKLSFTKTLSKPEGFEFSSKKSKITGDCCVFRFLQSSVACDLEWKGRFKFLRHSVAGNLNGQKWQLNRTFN